MLQHSIATPIIENDVATKCCRWGIPEIPCPLSSTYVQNHQLGYGHWTLVEQFLPKCMFEASRWSNTPHGVEWLVGHTPIPSEYGAHHLGYRVWIWQPLHLTYGEWFSFYHHK